MFHILLLSAGSLLGQNVLDALEGRRDRVRITGLNTVGGNPRVFRCDRAYKAPAALTPGFVDFLRDIVAREKPDLILPGRDEDLIFLAQLAEQDPEMARLIPGGSLHAVRIMNDKALSYRFAQEHGLPFAESFVLDASANAEQAIAWAARQGYPVLAKPREGFGSNGIRILCEEAHLRALLRRAPSGLVLQEMIDFGEDRWKQVQQFRETADAGVPLFFQVPDNRQYAGQALIQRDGTVSHVFTSLSLMVLGRCESAQPLPDPELVRVTRAYAEAFARLGWRGVFNLQCRKHGASYRVNELNGRMSGSTSARRYLGFDEPRELIRAFCNHDIGPDPRETGCTDGVVYRSLTDYFVPAAAEATFARDGVWTRKS